MKSSALLLLILLLPNSNAQANQTESKGACSPIILENKGEVTFTCQAALDPATAKKLNQVLNEVLSKGAQSADVSRKLDEILDFIHKAAPRSINDAQKQDFLKAAGTNDKGSVRLLLVGSDLESFAYSRQIGALLTAGGWQIEYRQGTVVNGDPSGIRISVLDAKNPSAVLLQQALKLIGIDAAGTIEPQQEVPIVLQVGPKPLAQ